MNIKFRRTKKKYSLNSKFLNNRKFGLFFLILLQSSLLFCQKTEVSFIDTDLAIIIKQIEDQSDFVFNYDPSLLSSYSFTGELQINNPQECIEKILYDSPFDFEINAKNILVYQPDPVDFKICGIVLDASTKTPLLFANILADKTNQGSQTGENGYFEMTIKGYKNQRVSISYIGYQPITYQLQQWAIEDCMTINLSVDEQLWKGEIIVTDYLIDGIAEGQDYGGYQLNYHQLATHHSTVEHDILKTAQLLPGITSLDESATYLQIRGSALDQNLILWEGATIYQSGHLFGMISAINPFSINEVNVFKGTYNPKYDNRVGGIIDISLVDSIQSDIHGSAGMTLTEAHINLETPLVTNKLSILLSGRHSINKLFNSPSLQSYTDKVFQFSKIDDLSEFTEDGSFKVEQVLNFYDWNTKVLYQPTDRLFVTVGLYKNNQAFEYNLSSPTDPFQTFDKINANSTAMQTKIDWEIDDKWTTSLAFLQSKYTNEFDYKEEENGIFLKEYFQFNNINDQSILLSTTYSHSTNLTFDFGYDKNVKQVNYNVINESVYEPDFEEKNFEKGSFHNFFASSKIQKPKYSFNGGLRVTYYEEGKKWLSSPRFNFQYAINPQLKLKTEAGIFHQFVSQLRNFGSNAVIADNPLWIINFSESDLSQRAKKMAAGLIYEQGGLLVDVEGYFNTIEGLSSLSPVFNTIEKIAFARGNSTAVGLDVLVKKRWANFNTWVNYSLGKITYLFPEIEETSFFAPNDIRHNLSLVSSYTYKDLQVTLNNSYHSGLPFTRPSGLTNIYDEVDEEFFYYIDFSAINNDRLRPYFRTDLSINYRPVFKKRSDLKAEFSFSLLNVFNRKNVFAREYYIDYGEGSETPTLAFIQKALLQTTPLILVRMHW